MLTELRDKYHDHIGHGSSSSSSGSGGGHDILQLMATFKELLVRYGGQVVLIFITYLHDIIINIIIINIIIIIIIIMYDPTDNRQ